MEMKILGGLPLCIGVRIILGGHRIGNAVSIAYPAAHQLSLGSQRNATSTGLISPREDESLRL